jgi:predicted heme/steroid binding protein
MTRKHYTRLAAALREARLTALAVYNGKAGRAIAARDRMAAHDAEVWRTGALAALDAAREELADVLAADPRFDRERFAAAVSA